jgi:hypothetical protein
MLYQLPNGKCIELTVEQYTEMSDIEWHRLLKEIEASTWGEEVNDPFAISVLYYGPHKSSNKNNDDYDNHEIEPDLTDISEIEKLADSDFIDIDNIEI